jgi:hypothetical protein
LVERATDEYNRWLAARKKKAPMSMQVNKWFNQETGLAPIDPKALERVKAPQPSFKNVFITGTVSKVIGPDCFELAAISISPHAGNGARLLSGRTLLVQFDTVSDLAGLKPGVALSLAQTFLTATLIRLSQLLGKFSGSAGHQSHRWQRHLR